MKKRLLMQASPIASTDSKKKTTLAEFRTIPGVGKSIAEDFWNLGFRAVDELVRKDPEELYQQLCSQMGCHVDRCMLYVFRCAVYFATEKDPKPELLKPVIAT